MNDRTLISFTISNISQEASSENYLELSIIWNAPFKAIFHHLIKLTITGNTFDLGNSNKI